MEWKKSLNSGSGPRPVSTLMPTIHTLLARNCRGENVRLKVDSRRTTLDFQSNLRARSRKQSQSYLSTPHSMGWNTCSCLLPDSCNSYERIYFCRCSFYFSLHIENAIKQLA